MDTHPKIEVYIFTKQRPEDASETISMFTGSSSRGLRCGVNLMTPEEVKSWDNDYAMCVQAFAKAQPDSYVIVCKDTAISGLKSETILDTIEAAIASANEDANNQFDIFYLAKWMDRCDLYSNQRNIGDRGLKLVDTVSPNGVLCLMFSPSGREKFMRVFHPDQNPVTDRPLGQVLNSRIGIRSDPTVDDPSRPVATQRFLAITCHPSIIYFDVTKRTTDAELAKATECRDIPAVTKPASKQSSNMGFFWFIVVVIVILIVAWVLIKLGSKITAPAPAVANSYALSPEMANSNWGMIPGF